MSGVYRAIIEQNATLSGNSTNVSPPGIRRKSLPAGEVWPGGLGRVGLVTFRARGGPTLGPWHRLRRQGVVRGGVSRAAS
jgi:hypothetical protein